MNDFVSLPKASFALKYNDISTSDTFGNYPVTNNVGTINATRTDATWYSINLENILGDLYNKYDMFTLRLNTLSYQQTAAFGVANFDRLVYFSLSGLDWANNNYSITRKTLINSAVVGCENFTQNVTYTSSYENSFVVTFRKQKTVDLRIQLLTLDGNAPTLNANTQFPRISWFFDIFPVNS
jgi:hypothetical protein